MAELGTITSERTGLMSLTPTQRNFHEQMKRVKQNPDPSHDIYHVKRRTVKFDPPSGRSTLAISIILTLAISLGAYYLKQQGPASRIIQPIESAGMVSSLETPSSGSAFVTRTVPSAKAFASYLNQIKPVRESINSVTSDLIQATNDLNAGQIDRASYAAYINQCKTMLDVQGEQLGKIVVPPEARAMHQDLMLQLSNTCLAADAMLSAVKNGSISRDEHQVIIMHLDNARDCSSKATSDLLRAFDSLGIKYTVKPDGTITYYTYR